MGMNRMIKTYQNNTLYFDQCNTAELAKKYGTPLYVISENSILKQCNEVKSSFLDRYPNTRAAYACKAFCTLAMCKIMEREGFCLDVVSGGELYTAIQANFPPEHIEFNGNNKQYEELSMAVEYGIGRIIIDGLQELALLEQVCQEKGKTANILYRITPGVTLDTHEYISTGKKDSKFGIPLDDDVIYPAIEAAINSKHVNFLGIHFHVGSQLFDNSPYLSALETSLKLMKETKKRFGFTMSELNVGGGYGIEYLSSDQKKPYSYFLDPVMERLQDFCTTESFPVPAVVIEPGRSIVGEAGLTLYTIGSIKDINGIRKYVSVDGGMTDNIRPGLYQALYEGVVANKAEEAPIEKVTISGKCCESTDILIKDTDVPAVTAGDIYAIFATGAYGYSMASNYNKIQIPAVVLVKDGRDELIVNRQSYDDMLHNELIPSSLK